MVNDLTEILTGQHITRRKITRTIIRWAEAEKKHFERMFEWSFLKRGLSSLVQAGSDIYPQVANDQSGYFKDGSRILEGGGEDIRPISKAGEWIIDDLLVSDLEILGSIKENFNIRVILYEAPLHQSVGRAYIDKPTQHARKHRKLIQDQCEKYGFECYFVVDEVVKSLPNLVQGWKDAEHPPEKQLAAWFDYFYFGEK